MGTKKQVSPKLEEIFIFDKTVLEDGLKASCIGFVEKLLNSEGFKITKNQAKSLLVIKKKIQNDQFNNIYDILERIQINCFYKQKNTDFHEEIKKYFVDSFNSIGQKTIDMVDQNEEFDCKRISEIWLLEKNIFYLKSEIEIKLFYEFLQTKFGNNFQQSESQDSANEYDFDHNNLSLQQLKTINEFLKKLINQFYNNLQLNLNYRKINKNNIMEQEILKRLNFKGVKLSLMKMQLSDTLELEFAQKTHKILQAFVNSPPKTKIKFNDFFMQNYDKYFSKKNKSKELAEYLSTMMLRNQSSEIQFYYYFYQQNVSMKVAKLFIKFYHEMLEINPNLYQNKSKLLRNMKMEVKKAIELGSQLLKDDIAMNKFSTLIFNHFQNTKGNYYSLSGEKIGQSLIELYIMMLNNKKAIKDQDQQEEEGIWINWNSTDPKSFTIEVLQHEKDLQPKFDDQNQPVTNNDQGANLNLEKLNNNYKKVLKKNREQKNGELNDKVINICYKYVFEDFETPDKLQQMQNEKDNRTGDDLDQEILKLQRQLETQQAEMDKQKDIWKLVLNSSKGAIKNYRNMKTEIDNLENLTDVQMGLIDKNTDEWRNLFMLKNNHLNQLKRYKFLIAAILENTKEDLQNDLREFRFAHDEDERNMRELFGKKMEFDLHEYLTTVYKGKQNFNIEEEEIQENEDQEEEEEQNQPEDQKDQYDSLANNLDQFKPNKIIVDVDPENPNIDDVKNNVEAIQQNEKYEKATKNKEMSKEDKNKHIKNMKQNLNKIKKNLIHGKSKDQKNKKSKQKLVEEYVDPKDVEREYVKQHYKQQNKKMKIPKKRVVKK